VSRYYRIADRLPELTFFDGICPGCEDRDRPRHSRQPRASRRSVDECNESGSSYTTCDGCSCDLDEDDVCTSEDGTYCEDCYSERYFRCDHCNETAWRDDSRTVRVLRRWGSPRWIDETWCEYCARNNATDCTACDDLTHDDDIVHTSSTDLPYCATCFKESHHRV
jgi:hypothetical protein